MSESSTSLSKSLDLPLPLAPPVAAFPDHNQGKRNKDSLQGWTIEAVFDSNGANTSHSRRSSFESSVLREDDDTCEENDNDDDEEFRTYNIDAALVAWDQIGELSHEITSSLMAKQASILCELFRHKTSSALILEPPKKKRRMEDSAPAGPSYFPNHDSLSTSTAVVISDEETASMNEGLPDDLSSQVDRIGRISKLVMEIEYCQQQLRREMVAMSDDF